MEEFCKEHGRRSFEPGSLYLSSLLKNIDLLLLILFIVLHLISKVGSFVTPLDVSR